MDMFALLGFGYLALFLVTVILPWVNRARIGALKAEVAALRLTVRALAARLEDEASGPVADAPPEPAPEPEAAAAVPPASQAPGSKAEDGRIHQPPAAPPPPDQPRKRIFAFRPGLELQLGARLPVWVGGIALALAGFFLVKYSIDQNLLTPAVRVILGGLLGLGLLASGHWVRGRQSFANGRRIAQSLSGAGLAVLYLALYAATSLYDLIPGFLGFLGLAATTATALTLSLRHGAPIALLGLVGGFVTPLLMGAQAPSTALLFAYLYLLFAAAMIVIRQRNWWLLSLPTLAGVFLWTGYWLVAGFAPDETVWLGLFLLAVSATIVIAARPAGRGAEMKIGELATPSALLNYLGLAGALGLMGAIAGAAGFGTLE